MKDNSKREPAVVALEAIAASNREPTLELYLAAVRAIAEFTDSMGLLSVLPQRIVDAVEDGLSLAAMKRGEVKAIRKPRSDDGCILRNWLEWHRGSGHLQGPMMWSMEDREFSDSADSYAQVRSALLKRGPTSAVGRWRSALGMDQ